MRTTRRVQHREMVVRRVRTRSSAVSAARYEERRSAKPRERAALLTRNRLRVAVGVLIPFAALFCVTSVYRSPLFAVRTVRVTGLAAMLPDEAAQVQAAALVPANTNLFHLSGGRLEAAIRRVPAVASATVRRRFPHGLEIAVVPRLPVAVVVAAGGSWEADRAGIAIRPERPGQNLPRIECAAAAMLAAGQRIDVPGVAGALSAATLTARGKPLGIAKIEVDLNGDLCLNMVDTVAIRIGQTDQLDTKLALVRRIYDDRPDIGAEVESIDLRFPEAPACLPRGAAKHASDAKPSSDAPPPVARQDELARDPLRTETIDHLDRQSSRESELDSTRPARRNRSRHQRRAAANSRSEGTASAEAEGQR